MQHEQLVVRGFQLYLSIYLSIYLPICLTIHVSIRLYASFTDASAFIFTYQFTLPALHVYLHPDCSSLYLGLGRVRNPYTNLTGEVPAKTHKPSYEPW